MGREKAAILHAIVRTAHTVAKPAWLIKTIESEPE
jgi:hypothetical protein